MDNLFYSIKEKIAFWVTGYGEGTDNVKKNIDYLDKKSKEFSKIANVSEDEILSTEITKSRRYKSMKVFYAKTSKKPENSFEIGNGWNMWKWLSD